jgi:hypothetical protein
MWQEIVTWKEDSLSDHPIIRFGISENPKIPHEYRNPLSSTAWDCYKTDLFSRFGYWDGDILTKNDIENKINMLQSKVIAT